MACSTMASEADFSTGAEVLMTYTRVMNSRSVYVASHYFSDNVVLDWFGRTIVGKSQVLDFLMDEVRLSNHDIVEVKSRKEFPYSYSMDRALRRFRSPSFDEKDEEFDMDNDSGFNSAIFEMGSDSSFSSSGSLTPCSKMASEMSKLNVSNSQVQISLSPALRTPPINARIPSIKLVKKQPLLIRSLKQVDVPKNLQFINAAGILSFVSEDDFFPGKNWSKPCHLQIGYQHQQSVERILFSFLLYNNDMPCRRNLSQIFDQCN